jgi:type IV pilus assembly protein PilB
MNVTLRSPQPRPLRITMRLIRDRNPSAAALQKAGCATVEELATAVATQFQLPRLELDNLDIAADLAKLVARPLAERHRIVPVFGNPQELTLAVVDPSELELFDWFGRELRRAITVVVATAAEIARAQRRLYEGRLRVTLDDEQENVSAEAAAEASSIVNRIISAAMSQGASDIHIEASERGTAVRFRVDGVLRTVETRPSELHAAIISRIKVLAQLDISIRHMPQDGRIKIPGARGDIDLRVSVLPTYWGEKVVCRVLDNARAVQSLEALGFPPAQRKDFLKMVQASYGLVLVTGPTGSGKSTTLYAALNAVLSPDVNVVTVEDPVEYQIPGINQVPVNAKRGLTFASALRSILRQDPDVILIGEIRDQETGVIAAEAALTGHLVMSSLHTNDAVGAITRLTEIGVAPYLVAPSLLGVVAQRLARKICPHCIERYEPPQEEIDLLGLDRLPSGTVVARGRGCASCHGTGYAGRTAIREVLQIDEQMRGLLARESTADQLRKHALDNGFKTMRFAALRAWLAGTTTAREVMRLTCG